MKRAWVTRSKRIATALLAQYPIFAIGVFFSFVLRARLQLGYWPQYGRPDPKTLNWDVHQNTIVVVAALVPFAVTISALLAAMPLLRSSGRGPRAPVYWFFAVLALISVSCLTFFAYLRYDPGGFVNWFLD